jgi:hypothetical protein
VVTGRQGQSEDQRQDRRPSLRRGPAVFAGTSFRQLKRPKHGENVWKKENTVSEDLDQEYSRSIHYYCLAEFALGSYAGAGGQQYAVHDWSNLIMEPEDLSRAETRFTDFIP